MLGVVGGNIYFASNMGHCLWAGIVDQDKAGLVAERLMPPGDVYGLGNTDSRQHNGCVQPGDLPQRVSLAP